MTTTTPHTEPALATSKQGNDDKRRPSVPRSVAQRTVDRLQSGYRQNDAAAVAAVARLRREAGRDLYTSPSSWGLEYLDDLVRLREQRRLEDHGSSDPSPHLSHRIRLRQEQQEEREERAVHLAVTLWALHQQSIRDHPMHVSGWSLGRAVRRLADGGTGAQDEPARPSADNRATDRGVHADSPVRTRFVRIGTSVDFDMLGRRLREMVLLLRNARIPLDYGLLAEQLCHWQDEALQGSVRRSWGRDFHRFHQISPANDEEETPSASAARTPDASLDDVGE
ncbi:type I-E CRISPR-associated protein Cse2/CasB [Streptomyces thermoalcalitolerans]|uniref:Type I-E CRISPR-associated protein Cse2/CasB n=1 Tax=Streptomyces thermoalcalitolerans TaxID=65605 RepID=A0ABN1NBE8_9ACTN